MSEKEPNKYKDALGEAKTTIRSEIDTLSGDGDGLATRVSKHVAANEGWVCSEADTWVTELTTQCSPVLTAFEDAYDEVVRLHNNQPDEVDAGDWRGLAYRNGS